MVAAAGFILKQENMNATPMMETAYVTNMRLRQHKRAGHPAVNAENTKLGHQSK